MRIKGWELLLFLWSKKERTWNLRGDQADEVCWLEGRLPVPSMKKFARMKLFNGDWYPCLSVKDGEESTERSRMGHKGNSSGRIVVSAINSDSQTSFYRVPWRLLYSKQITCEVNYRVCFKNHCQWKDQCSSTEPNTICRLTTGWCCRIILSNSNSYAWRKLVILW